MAASRASAAAADDRESSPLLCALPSASTASRLSSTTIQDAEGSCGLTSHPKPLLTFIDFASHVNVTTGSRNINEFVPYTIVSWSKKGLELALIATFHGSLREKGINSQNGANFTGIANLINGCSIAVASLALMVLVTRSLLNVRRVWRIGAAVRPGGMMASEEQLAALRGVFMRDCRIKSVQGCHTLVLALAGLCNGITVALDTYTVGRGDAIARVALVSALATVILVVTKNAADLFVTARKIIRTRRVLSAMQRSPAASASGTLASADVIEGVLFRLHKVYLVERVRGLSLSLVTIGLGTLLLGLAGAVPIIVVLAVYLAGTIVGQGISLFVATPIFKRILATRVPHCDCGLLADAAFYTTMQELLVVRDEATVAAASLIMGTPKNVEAEIELLVATGLFALCRDRLAA